MIRPYSMAVAPFSSFKKLMTMRMSGGDSGKGGRFYPENLMEVIMVTDERARPAKRSINHEETAAAQALLRTAGGWRHGSFLRRAQCGERCAREMCLGPRRRKNPVT